VSAENTINNPSKVFTEPCEACGVSEFQLGVRHAEERIIKLLENNASGDYKQVMLTPKLIAQIKGEQN
jgi:hypothetical protein